MLSKDEVAREIEQAAIEAEKIDNDEHCSGVTIVPILKLREWANRSKSGGGMIKPELLRQIAEEVDRTTFPTTASLHWCGIMFDMSVFERGRKYTSSAVLDYDELALITDPVALIRSRLSDMAQGMREAIR